MRIQGSRFAVRQAVTTVDLSTPYFSAASPLRYLPGQDRHEHLVLLLDNRFHGVRLSSLPTV